MERETLPPLTGEVAPQTFDGMWTGFDPRAEPLDVEILREWEEDGVVLQVLRYRIGVFKGRKATMAAVFGYPKGGSNLPGLVQIHGGGQYADYRAPLTNAKRGYASISISWAGRIHAPDYRVTPDEVRLFWDGRTDDPKYRVTTDWGALDGYHHPTRNPENAFGSTEPHSWTLDEVDSPRNSAWFLGALGARRALTFLERQPQIDAERLGVYGHSMGGKLTVLTTAADARVKAAAPSCGGISDRAGEPSHATTLADHVNLARISCPIVFLSPSNDFHGRIDDLPKALHEIKSGQWRVTCSPHHNHQDTPEYEVATQLWFDQHLKGGFSWPKTPDTSLELAAAGGVPRLTVKPDASRPILYVDVYYTRHGQMDGLRDDRDNTMNRFWHHAAPTKEGNVWTAELPLHEATARHSRPLWAYANVVYSLDRPITGAGYYYGTYTAISFNLSSPVHVATAEELGAAGVKGTLQPSPVIETFEGNWQKEWFTHRPEQWARTTHKIHDPRWLAPDSASLAVDVRCEEPNTLVVRLDGYAAEASLKGSSEWQRVVLRPSDFHDVAGRALPEWAGLRELRLCAQETLRSNEKGVDPVPVGGEWTGAAPKFRALRWIVE